MSITKKPNSMTIGDFQLFYSNYTAAQEIYEEIFVKKVYDFFTTKKAPVIIDVGSNIGISVLFFKNKYPQATIICFEPDPTAFKLLEKNIAINNLQNVQAFNVALSNQTGTITLYGEVDGLETDQRGNSIIDVWGKQRISCSEIMVQSACLSSYINQEIDFLKMDIEGAEQMVIEELGDKLQLIKKICMEVHEVKNKKINNSLEQIYLILKNYKYKLKIKPQHIIKKLPEHIAQWVKNVKPKFSMLEASRY